MIKIVYKISSIINPDRVYIGSSCEYEVRKKGHLRALRGNYHHSKKLQRHYNKYGVEDLIFDIIEIISNDDSITDREQFYIDTLDPYFNGVKRAIPGPIGLIQSEEARRKKGLKSLGNKYCLGFKHSDETKAKHSEFHKNRIRKPMSEETKQKIAATKELSPKSIAAKIKKMGPKMRMKGGNKKGIFKHTEETKEKIRKWNIGRKMSPESLQKRQETIIKNNKPHRRGFKMSPEAIAKSSFARTGQKMSIESCEKMSAAKGCQIINTETKEIFKSIKLAAKLNGINESTLSAKVRGRIKNDTVFMKLAS